MPDAPPRRPAINAWFRQPPGVRLPYVMEMMRDLSRQTEPAAASRLYGERIGRMLETDARISLSRRGLGRPFVRVTQSPVFGRTVDPWAERASLPLVEGGVLAELIWSNDATICNDFVADPADPAYEHLKRVRSFAAIPLFDAGESLNMVLVCRHDAGAFTDDFLPEHVWFSNLFGRATTNLVTKKELERTTARLEAQMRGVGEIQRSLLPAELPTCGCVDVAAHYQTSEQAGGDYYDFVELPDGRLGMLIADVSGHGTPAAVIMAVTHAIFHLWPGRGTDGTPGDLLSFVNRTLAEKYTKNTGTFVTAFLAIYDPATRELVYSSAGHNPPRVKRSGGGPSGILEAAPALPLGIDGDETYPVATQSLSPGDTLVLYTDGITEARDAGGGLFGTDRLDATVQGCHESSEQLVRCVVAEVESFSGGTPAQDDRTLLVVRV